MDDIREIMSHRFLKKYHKNAGKKGFTLVELITVLVILAILAAVLIPTLLGWIDRSRQVRYIQEARECVNAANAVVAEQYGFMKLTAENKDEFLNKENEASIKELAEVDGDITEISLAENLTLSALYYKAADGTWVSYKVDREPRYLVGDEQALSAESGILDQIMEGVKGTVWMDVVASLKKDNPNYTFPLIGKEISDAYLKYFGQKAKSVLNRKLTWKPVSLKGSNKYIMIASDAEAGGERNDAAALADNPKSSYSGNAYIIYDGTSYYVHNNGHENTPDSSYVGDQEVDWDEVMKKGWIKLKS